MEVVCTQNKQSYTILTFLELSVSEIERYRHSLICKCCEGSAYYRKKSSSGRRACFGAFHKEACNPSDAKSEPNEPEERQDIEDVQQVIARDDLIEAHFGLPTSGAGRNADNNSSSQEAESNESNTKRHSQSPPKYRHSKLGMRTLLNSLIYKDGFPSRDMKVVINGYQYNAKNLFVRFEDSAPYLLLNSRKTRPHMYWGQLSGMDKEMAWLNTGGARNIGIPLGDYKSKILDAFGIEDPEDVVGCYALVFGYCKVNKASSAVRIEINEPGNVYIKARRA